MAISVENLIKERRYPFIFSLLALILVTVLLLTKTQSPINSTTLDLVQSRSQPTSSPPPPSPPPPRPPPLVQKPPISSPSSNSTPPEHIELSWNLCNGAVAVDYIPCLDNWKAIKELKSRRHMEHRERHCPVPSPRCLVPLPVGYRVPVPWPKSRDMVR